MPDNNEKEFERWFNQASYDLKSAKDSRDSGNFEWSCFQSQQAAEKALKAYLYKNRMRVIITHSIRKLLRMCGELDEAFSRPEVMRAKELDTYYIPTRYPNGLEDDYPHAFYIKEDAEKCVNYAEEIINLVEKITRK